MKRNNYKNYMVLVLFSLIIIYLGYEYYSKYFFIIKDPVQLKNIILSYGRYGIYVFLLLQIIQVVVFFIPGEVVQISGGYIYGTLLGSIISLVGISFGSFIVFILSRRFGKPFVKKIVSGKNWAFFRKILNLGKINYVIFFLYLIPGIPKDAMAYISGVSEVKTKDFMVYSTLGRLPCIFISAYFGKMLNSNQYDILIIMAVLMTALFIIGVLKGENILNKLMKHHK